MIASPRYALVQRLLHWVIAALVLGALALGLIFGFLGFKGTRETFGPEVTNFLFMCHKSFGVTILGLMVLRLIVKRRLGRPEYVPPLSRFEHIASHAVHGLLYVVLIVMPMVGWAATGAGGYPVEFYGTVLPGVLGKDKALSETLYGVHGFLGWCILVLVLAHIAGAVYHWRIKRDGVMARMSLG